MGKKEALGLRDWLTNTVGPERVRNIRPVKVTFQILAKTFLEYYGVEYDAVDHYLPTERAVTDGGKKAGDEYLERRYMLLGVRSKIMAAQKRMWPGSNEYCCKYAWRKDGDDGDWYFSSYIVLDASNKDYHHLHPCGSNFLMSRWPHENPWHGPIDQYDAEKKERKHFAVEYL